MIHVHDIIEMMVRNQVTLCQFPYLMVKGLEHEGHFEYIECAIHLEAFPDDDEIIFSVKRLRGRWLQFKLEGEED